jgi:hypothetical protein
VTFCVTFQFTKRAIPILSFHLSHSVHSPVCRNDDWELGENSGQVQGVGPLGSQGLLMLLNLSQLEEVSVRLSLPCPAWIPAHGGTTSLHPCAGHPPVSVTSSSSDSCGSSSWSACRHVSSSARPGYHDNRMQGTRASVGCGSRRGSAIGEGGDLFLPPVGSLARAGAAGEWEPLPSSMPWHFLPAICAGSWGRGWHAIPGGRGLGADGWEEQPSLLGCAPPPDPRTLPGPLAHHSLPLLGTNGSSRPSSARNLVSGLGVETRGRNFSKEGS